MEIKSQTSKMMKILSSESLHIYLSYLFFIVSCSTIAFYADNFGNKMWSLFVFLLGWLGIFIGAFQWYANIFYFLALIQRRNIKASIILATIGLLIALSFFIIEPPITFGGPDQPIVGYGFGYGLWLSSMAIFIAGQVLLLLDIGVLRRSYILLFLAFFFVAITSFEYFYGKRSPYSFHAKQSSIFEQYCKQSKINIYHKVNNIESIYFDHAQNGLHFGNNFGYEWSSSVGTGLVNVGYIESYEYMKNGKYYKVFADSTRNYKINTTNIASPNSSIMVSITGKSYPIYGIDTKNIIIKDIKTNIILGEAFVVVEMQGSDFKHCPEQGFSTEAFVKDVLNLKANRYKNYIWH